LDFKQQIRQCVSRFIYAVKWLKSKRRISFWKSFFLLILNHHIIEKRKKKNYFDVNRKINNWIIFFYNKLKKREKKFYNWIFFLKNLKQFLNSFKTFFWILLNLRDQFFYTVDSFFFDLKRIFWRFQKIFYYKFFRLFLLKKRIFSILKDQKNLYWLNYFLNQKKLISNIFFDLKNFYFLFFKVFSSDFFFFFFFSYFSNWWDVMRIWKNKFSWFYFFYIKKFLLNLFYLNFFKKRIRFLKNQKRNRKNYFHLRFILPEKFSTKNLLKNKKFLINFKSFNKIRDEQQRNKRLHPFYDGRLKHRHLFLRMSKFGQEY
jgi:hypothetical protein